MQRPGEEENCRIREKVHVKIRGRLQKVAATTGPIKELAVVFSIF